MEVFWEQRTGWAKVVSAPPMKGVQEQGRGTWVHTENGERCGGTHHPEQGEL